MLHKKVRLVIMSVLVVWVGAANAGWPMHEIDNPQLILPNGLDAADINKDGFPDYATNYEASGQFRVAFYPGPDKVKEPWPSIEVGKIVNAESTAVGDLDGDGHIDIVVASGSEFGSEASGIKVVWGPEADRAEDPQAWTDGGIIPSTIAQGHYTFILTKDVNADGVADIVVGGRRHGVSAGKQGSITTGVLTGLKWVESPEEPEHRRDPTKWLTHDIDAHPRCYGTYGFRFGDLDNDGDDDVATVDCDWDTPVHQRRLVWWENPGNGTPEQKNPWKRTIVYHGPEFYTKPQIAIGDLDGNGTNDIVVQTDDSFYWFKNSGAQPGQFERIIIPKALEARWRSRPTRLADLNGDGKLDIVGMLIHRDGYLPEDRAAVFWMEYEGKELGSENWKTHVIKHGDGFRGRGIFNGEKWDQATFYDVDRDGDLDIVANCEEYHERGKVHLAVLWFENPLR